MKVVIHPYRNGRVEKSSDWIDNLAKVLFVRMVTNSITYQALKAPIRIYPPRLNGELLKWMLDE